MIDESLAVPARLFLEVMPGCQWLFGSSRVRMGVNPKGILEGGTVRPTGRAWLPEAGSCQGRKRLWNSRLWEKHWPSGRVFSAGAFEANSALVPYSLLHREMEEGKPPPPTGSLSPGEQDKKLGEGAEEGCGVSSSSPTPEEDSQMDGWRGEWVSEVPGAAGGGEG